MSRPSVSVGRSGALFPREGVVVMGEALLGYLTALGLSTAVGLNAYIPLLLLGWLSRATDLISLPAPWSSLEDPVVLAVIAVIGAIDLVGDKIPVVDHMLHAMGMVIAPIAGAIVALGAADSLDLEPAVAGVIGIAAALATHVGRSAARPISTAATGGAANPALSLGEDGLSALLSVTAIIWPVLACLLVLGIAIVLIVAIRKWRALGRRIDRSDRAVPG